MLTTVSAMASASASPGTIAAAGIGRRRVRAIWASRSRSHQALNALEAAPANPVASSTTAARAKPKFTSPTRVIPSIGSPVISTSTSTFGRAISHHIRAWASAGLSQDAKTPVTEHPLAPRPRAGAASR